MCHAAGDGTYSVFRNELCAQRSKPPTQSPTKHSTFFWLTVRRATVNVQLRFIKHEIAMKTIRLAADALDLVNLTVLMRLTSGSAEIVIGLIDGPVPCSHPDLANDNIRTLSGKIEGRCISG